MNHRLKAICFLSMLVLVGCSAQQQAAPVTSTVTAAPVTVQETVTTSMVSTRSLGPVTVTAPALTKTVTPEPVTLTPTATTVGSTSGHTTTAVATPDDAPAPSTTAPTDTRKFWPVANDAGTGNLPFPADGVYGQVLQHTWTVQRNVFGEPWMNVDGPDESRFPSTMNGCEGQTFLVRWRASNPGVSLDAQYTGAGGDTHKLFTATDGWMSLDGCETPQLRLHTDNPNELAGSVVTVEQFTAVG